jgi:hypothetical protein
MKSSCTNDVPRVDAGVPARIAPRQHIVARLVYSQSTAARLFRWAALALTIALCLKSLSLGLQSLLPEYVNRTYTIVGTWFLFIDEAGLHVSALQLMNHINLRVYYAFLEGLLLVGLVWQLLRPGILAFVKKAIGQTRGRGGHR